MPQLKQPNRALKLTNVSIVKLRVGELQFQLACYPNKVPDWRNKKETDISQVLQSNHIFSDVSKGYFVRNAELKSAFGTTDWLIIVTKILTEGEIQLTNAERTENRNNYIGEVFRLVSQKIYSLSSSLLLTLEQLKEALTKYRISVTYQKKVPEKVYAHRICLKLIKADPKQYCFMGGYLELKARSTDTDKDQQFIDLTTKIENLLNSIQFFGLKEYHADNECSSSTDNTIENSLDSVRTKQRIVLKANNGLLHLSFYYLISDSGMISSFILSLKSNAVEIVRNTVNIPIPASLCVATNLHENLENKTKDSDNISKDNTQLGDEQNVKNNLNSFCGVCNSAIENFKQHLKSNWHTVNLKLNYKGLPPVSEAHSQRLKDIEAIDYLD